MNMATPGPTALDMFYYLNSNNYRGAIVAHDRESQKIILFADEGIYALSKGKRKGLRLVELLRREGNIDKQILEDALTDERESNFKIHFEQILINQGHLTESVLDVKMKYIIEDEIYDLFFWKKAKYSFDPNATKNSLFKESDLFSFWKTDTTKFAHTLLTNITHWGITQENLPDENTIFVIDNEQFGKIRNLGLTRQMVQEAQRFGDCTLEEFLQNSTLTKPENCQLVFTLLSAQILRPMDIQQAHQLAQQAEAQQNLPQAISYYTYCCLSTPEINLNMLNKLSELIVQANRRQQAILLLENVGWDLYEKGKFSTAIQVAELGLKYSQGNQSLITLQFNCYAQLANSEQVLRLGKTLGGILMSKKKWKESIEHYKYLLEWFPNNADVMATLSDAYVKINRIKEAIQLLSKSADIYESQRKKEDALRTYKQILDIDPERQDIAKKVLKMELIKKAKKIATIAIPIIISITLVIHFINQARIQSERIKKANKLHQNAIYQESNLVGPEKIKQIFDKKVDHQQLKTIYQKVQKRYQQAIENYRKTKTFIQSYKLDLQDTLTSCEKKIQQLLNSQKNILAEIEKLREKKYKLYLKEQQRKREKLQIQKEISQHLTQAQKKMWQKQYQEAKQHCQLAFQKAIQLYEKFSTELSSLTIKLPIYLDSLPQGATVYKGNSTNSAPLPQKTPLIDTYFLGEDKIQYTFQAKGFQTITTRPMTWNNFLFTIPFSKSIQSLKRRKIPLLLRKKLEILYKIFPKKISSFDNVLPNYKWKLELLDHKKQTLKLTLERKENFPQKLHVYRNHFLFVKPTLPKAIHWTYQSPNLQGPIVNQPITIHPRYNVLLFSNRENGAFYGIRYTKKKFHTIWQFKSDLYGYPGDFFTQPKILDQITVVGTTGGDLFFFQTSPNQKKTKLIKKINTGSKILDAPFVLNESTKREAVFFIAFGNLRGDVYIYRILWRKQGLNLKPKFSKFFHIKTENSILASPTLEEDLIYIPGTDNQLQCYRFRSIDGEKLTGHPKPLWILESQGDFPYPILTTKNTLIASCTDGYIYGINKNKSLLQKKPVISWRLHIGPNFSIPPILYKTTSQTLLVVSYKNNIYALDFFKLSKEAQHAESQGNTLSFPAGTIPSHTISWKIQLENENIQYPPLFEPLPNSNAKFPYWVYVVSDKNIIRGFDMTQKTNSRFQWKHQVPGLLNPPVIHKNKMYYCTSKGKIGIHCLLLAKPQRNKQ
ncbi:MAG: hypothetical protein D6805_09585 [Planctomycetota bacterium]|nr:MAG: hypothetical protein D6805_09585 [Planctomycetota bacterium]